MNWTDWIPFPEPNQIRRILAPKGSGVYELKNQATDEWVLVGISINIRKRMKSLMPSPYGVGRRNNYKKRQYVLNNYCDIVYRTLPTRDRQEAEDVEKTMLSSGKYIYNT